MRKTLALTNWRRAETAGQALEIIRQLPKAVERGLEFEQLFALVARNLPELEVKNIFRMSEWRDASRYGLDGRDIGVDRVAVLNTGETVAIQCKCYQKDHSISKADVQSFLAGSQNEAFDLRWLVITNNITDQVIRLVQNTNIKIIDFQKYSTSLISIRREVQDKKREPFCLQQEAIDAVVEGFTNPENQGRGQLIMACGTGKTFTALRIAEHLVDAGKPILFLAPSIALVAQARREWLEHTVRPLRCAVVCSDRTVGKSEDISVVELSFSVTTEPEKIADAVGGHQEGTPVVFSTYQSLPKVISAQKDYGMPAFELALVDEAHRTTGIDSSDTTRVFQLIHDKEQIRCSKRLYMTATQRVYGEKAKSNRQAKSPELTITDMSDSQVYGPRFYQLSFMKAVQAGMLCDVRVVCLALREDLLDSGTAKKLESISNRIAGAGKPPDIQEYLSAMVIGLALNGWVDGGNPDVPRGGLNRTLAYANTIRRSKWLAEALGSDIMKEFIKNRHNDNRVIDIEAVHLDARSSAYKRNQELLKLNNAGTDGVARVISNCRLFTEGVDVPALNSIAFMDPKSSETDIVQAIGRVMRKAGEDKQLGYIIVPVALDSDQSLLDALQQKSPRFQILGKVLRALQSHDGELYSRLHEIVIADEDNNNNKNKDGEADDGDDDVKEKLAEQLLLWSEEYSQAVYAQLANYSGLGDRGRLVADIIINAVKRAARIFIDEEVAPTLAEGLGTASTVLDELEETEQKKKLEEAVHTAALIICNACLMHKRIEIAGILGGLQALDKLGSKQDIIGILLGSWQKILEKDYKPIFAEAVYLLELLKERHADKVNIQSAFHILVNCAVDTSEGLNELGYDHAGPLYHRILKDAQSQGAFYTKNISALLLAKLAFHDELVDWSDVKKINELRVIDPCCGTGTLLMAGLNVIKQKVAKEQADPASDGLHRDLVEHSIHGLDINKSAVQLAACNVTLGAPDVAYEQMNFYALDYGLISNATLVNPDSVRQGAIELLNFFDATDMDKGQTLSMPLENTAKVSGKQVNEDEKAVLALPSQYDVVMMNPPFTDTSRMQGQFTPEVSKAMQKRLGSLSKRLNDQSSAAGKALAKMSIQPFFTPLADQLVKDGAGGTLAKIVPTTACTANNGIDQRRYLASKFHIEMVITSHHPKDFAFSASTSIHESMFIARRLVGQHPDTKFIQLAKKPTNAEQVDSLVEAIVSGELGDWGSCTHWPAEKMQQGDWSPVQWYSKGLVEAVVLIEGLNGLRRSGEVYSWSPGGREFRGNFNYDTRGSGLTGKANACCSIQEDLHKMMDSGADCWAEAKPGKERQAQKLLDRGGHVLVPTRLSTTSCRTLAVFSEQPTIGSAFRPIDSADKIPLERAKAYTVFLNSSFGALQFLNRRTKKLTYPAYETGHMETLLLPAADDLGGLVALFDEVRGIELQRLANADTDEVRQRLDYAVADLLGVDKKLTDKWRGLLAVEPTVSNKPRCDKKSTD